MMCSSPKEEAEETLTFDETKDDTSSGAVVCDPEKYQEVFQARHRLSKLTTALGETVHCALFVQCGVPY